MLFFLENKMTVVAIDIDPQKTFTPVCAGELPVPFGDEIVAELNAQAALADYRAVSKDAHSPAAQWLCASHAEILRPTGLPDAPESWVAHAMIGSHGFELLDGLPDVRGYDFCVWKGIEPDMHPYGACYHDHAGRLSTGLIEWLRDVRAQVLVVGGLATDFCVKESVLQLAKAGGWRVLVNRAACRGIAADSIARAWAEMAAAGTILLDDAAAVKDYLAALEAA